MTQITEKGKKLAASLNPSIGTTTEILEICSLVCRHTVTYHRVQEDYCNGHPLQKSSWVDAKRMSEIQTRFDEQLAIREAQLEKRITELVDNLPHTDAGPIVARFGGDPRGCVVTLLMPDGNYNNWERDGICVPTY